jgi:drug/metabolite transporter (DMT)-like permease
LATSSSLLLAKTGVGGEVSTLEAAWVRLAAGVVAVGLVSAVRGHLRADLGVLRLPGLVRELGVAVIVVMFGGFWLSLVSLRYADASVATALAATEPVFVLPLAKWWLGERVTIAAVVAACVVVIGVGLIVVGTG